ncbi:xanthine dehydrogenase [Apis cerana cerana]|uniref:Xanthine dehydrogenase n=1 Tax=Apis cerana cerana TaxID=94128 RepID=A0A2A3DZR2_APICC|nr:xanthine dehydrogenase [Apis cerana cerana]
MVHDNGIINQSKPVILNNEEKLDRISHTLVFYVNGKENS